MQHGTHGMYRHKKCRCDLCKEANRLTGLKYRRIYGAKERKMNQISFDIVDMGYETPCYLWTGSLFSNGYGRWPKTSTGAHREMYKITEGDIPEELVLDHLCRNRSCVRGTHLEPVTQQINVLRGDLHK